MHSGFSFGQVTDMLQRILVRVRRVHHGFDFNSLVALSGEDASGQELLCLVPRLLLPAHAMAQFQPVAPILPMGATPLSPPCGGPPALVPPSLLPYRHSLAISVFAARGDGTVVKDRYGWFRVGNTIYGCSHPQIREIPLFTSIVRECAICGTEIKDAG